jgi:hypothetical protein
MGRHSFLASLSTDELTGGDIGCASGDPVDDPTGWKILSFF